MLFLCSLGGIEAQFGLARVCIRAVAGKTFICKDGPDISREIGQSAGMASEKDRACELSDDGCSHPTNLSGLIPG